MMPPAVRLRPLLPLLLLAAVAALVLDGLRTAWQPRIDTGRQRMEMQPVFEVLPLAFDNDPLADRITLTDLEQPVPAVAYRARAAGRPVGVVVMPVVARGYNGDIALAVGIAHDGTLTGLRIVQHRETPGLGDQVHQQHSRWVEQFTGRSLADTPAADWAVAADGGRFDAVSGATITPRGIIRAVHALLERHRAAPDAFYR